MSKESIYGEYLPKLEAARDYLVKEIEVVREEMKKKYDLDPVEHLISRIKSEESMREKCRRKGFEETTESALTKIFDAVGIRVVCAFISDVYVIRDHLVQLPNCELVKEKDYIKRAKDNGYRSYHMILKLWGAVYVEIQLRTISQDTWAALEHHLYYKKEKMVDDVLIEAELKRCADELASTDLSMQTIRDMIQAGKEEKS
ncbi:MAG: GTP pyrophosphokinase family protein [Lachnospiraceae bacterium]|nr:GTP pyrophosphokinase family protein [Lachnospiraceae bacterium]